MEKQKQIAKVNGQELSFGNADSLEALGFEGWSAKDVVVPVLKLVQPTSRLDITPGKFVDMQTFETFNELYAVFVKASFGRVYFENDSLLCKSYDRIVPASTITAPPSQSCKDCQFAKWIGEVPPACKETLNTVLFTVNLRDGEFQLGFPYLWSVHGSNLKPLKSVLSVFVVRKMPLWSKVVKMVPVKVDGVKGKYYIVKYEIAGDVPAESQRGISEFARGVSSELIEKSFEEMSKEDSVNLDELNF
jgi:hypothetical protein